jgi:hypothetical protein
VIGWPWLLSIAAVSLVPGLWRGARLGGLALGVRILQAILVGLLVWQHPVLALWLLLIAHVIVPWRRSWWTVLLALAPALALLTLGAAAWWRGVVNGVWLAPWEVVVALLALALAFLGLSGGTGGRQRPLGRWRRQPATRASPRRDGG